MTDGRRTDTRRRIHEAALDVFSERGYERATLREIAERLEITRPALYYHFKSKEEILADVHRELAATIDDVLTWARSQPPDASTRTEVVGRLSVLSSGPWGRFTAFAEANEAAMRDLTGAADFIEKMDVLTELLCPTDTIDGRIRARLALSALFMARARGRQLGGTATERASAALAIAVALVS
jgi:AcrR family transcriptional regulator